MSSLGDGAMNLPFEKLPQPAYGEEIALDDAALSAGVVVMAAAVDAEDGKRWPALVFRFGTPTGEFYKPMILVLTDDEALGLETLVADAARAAVEAARKGR